MVTRYRYDFNPVKNVKPAYAHGMIILKGLNRVFRLFTRRSAQTIGPGLLRSVRCARRCRIKSEGTTSGFSSLFYFAHGKPLDAG